MDVHEVLADAYGRVAEDVHRVVDGLTQDELEYRPGLDANTIAWLVWHIARIQDDHVADVAGVPQVWLTDGWAERFDFGLDPHDVGYGHTTEQVGQVRGVSGKDLLAYFDAVYAATGVYLATLKPADLDRVVDRRWDPPVTLGVRLVSVVNDNTEHVGQAAYVRGLVRQA